MLEIGDDDTGYEALAVRPDLCGKGFGTAMLQALLATPEAKQAKNISGGVDPENLASVRCHEKAGFLPQSDGPDYEGFVFYAR